MPRRHDLRWRVGVTQTLVAVDWFAALVSLCLILLVEVETVIVTGPILFILAALTVRCALGLRYARALWLGVAQGGICVLFLTLVNLLRWSPHSAHRPFLAMGAAYVLMTAPLAWLAWRDPPTFDEPWKCRGCGYLLFGLAEARCPECGLGFDIAAVAGALPSVAAASTVGAESSEGTRPGAAQLP